MAHLQRIWSDATFARGFVTTGAQLRDLDINTFKAIDGDNGGVWAPSSPINIEGAGMTIAAIWRGNGSGFELRASPGEPLEFNSGKEDDYFGFEVGNTARNATVLTTLQMALTIETERITRFLDCDSLPLYTEFAVPTFNNFYPGYVVSRLTTIQAQGDFKSLTPNFVTPLNVYNGGTFESATISFVVCQTQGASLPQLMPRMRVIAVSNEGVIIPLRTEDATTDIDGFQVLANPADPTAWRAAGAMQTFLYECTVDHKVDLSKYAYYVEVYGQYPSTASAPGDVEIAFYAVNLAFEDIEIFDGRS